jgi:hypothetical protein
MMAGTYPLHGRNLDGSLARFASSLAGTQLPPLQNDFLPPLPLPSTPPPASSFSLSGRERSETKILLPTRRRRSGRNDLCLRLRADERRERGRAVKAPITTTGQDRAPPFCSSPSPIKLANTWAAITRGPDVGHVRLSRPACTRRGGIPWVLSGPGLLTGQIGGAAIRTAPGASATALQLFPPHGVWTHPFTGPVCSDRGPRVEGFVSVCFFYRVSAQKIRILGERRSCPRVRLDLGSAFEVEARTVIGCGGWRTSCAVDCEAQLVEGSGPSFPGPQEQLRLPSKFQISSRRIWPRVDKNWDEKKNTVVKLLYRRTGETPTWTAKAEPPA